MIEIYRVEVVIIYLGILIQQPENVDELIVPWSWSLHEKLLRITSSCDHQSS